MARKYLGGSGDALTVWISLAASTVLIFYGYDQVCAVLRTLCLNVKLDVDINLVTQGVFGNVYVGSRQQPPRT
jgi:hypothetical protein